MEPPGQPPPLSPVLLAGLALRPLPPALLQPVLGFALEAVRRRHRGLFDRLAPLADTTFLIDPLDLPFSFLLRPATRPPSLKIVRDGGGVTEAAATIRGPLLTLIELLEGRVDADGLFFSRELAIEGDTAAIMALRNAVDGAGIDVMEIMAGALGPLSGAARRAAAPVTAIFRRMTRDLNAVQAALIAPTATRCEVQAAELEELREEMLEIRRVAMRADAKLRNSEGSARR